MKRIFLATGLLFFIFQLLSAQKTIRIYPTDDTYIHGGNNKAKYDRVQGLDDPLQLKSYYNKAKVYQYTTYLKFDLSKNVCKSGMDTKYQIAYIRKKS